MIFKSFHIVNVNSCNGLVISRDFLACRKETFIEGLKLIRDIISKDEVTSFRSLTNVT